MLAAAFVSGIIFWGGFNWSMELTNTESFCISCHEMRDNVYLEYKNSTHASNQSGVRASCPDCHVPREWVHMFVRKIFATNELFHHFVNPINTREQFLERRLELAEIVWRNMRRTNSRECRNCHSLDTMNLNNQGNVARDRHREALSSGATCIDCHQGIAHELPEAFLEEEHLRYEREDVACSQCHARIARPPEGDDWWE
ncbi:MAG: NapC/NirT family cytochrome c [Gammaproteobacteria bacterium]